MSNMSVVAMVSGSQVQTKDPLTLPHAIAWRGNEDL